MWALVKSNSVDTVYDSVRAVIIGDIKYPKEIFTLWTEAERKAIGVYDIVRKDQPDNHFYDVSDSTFIYDAGDDVVNENFDTTEKDIALMKTEWKKIISREAFRLIMSYAWLVERYVYDNTKAIPDAVKSYTASVRTHCDTICTAIDGCSDLDDAKIVHAKIHADDGEYKTGWPDESGIIVYNRDF